MGKVDRKKLTRGLKILPEHVTGDSTAGYGLDEVRRQLNASEAGDENLQRKKGRVRLSWHIPHISSDYMRDPSTGNNSPVPYIIPFMMPPHQEDVSVVYGRAPGNGYSLPRDAPRLTLKEAILSFDQRDEPAAITDQFSNGDPTGSDDGGVNLFYDDSSVYDLKFSLLERSSSYFGFQATAKADLLFDGNAGLPDSEVFSVDIPGSVAFFSAKRRANPYLVPGLNKTINPYSTYAISIEAPNIAGDGTANPTDNTFCIPSLRMELVFETDVGPRDTTNLNDPQNAPDINIASPTGTSATSIVIPAASSTIQADAATDGVSQNLDNIEQAFKKGLGGGYMGHESAQVEPTQELADDSIYDIIAVPLFSGRVGNGIYSDLCRPLVATFAPEPYIDLTTGDAMLADRRIFPVPYPMTVHHVFMTWNWMSFYPWEYDAPAIQPTPNQSWANNANLTGANQQFDVSVGVLNGIRSDEFSYQTIAQLDAVNPAGAGSSWFQSILDCWTPPGTEGQRALGNNGAINNGNAAWGHELHQVPLVGTGGGTILKPQGRPVFISPAWNRNAIAEPGGGYPNVPTVNRRDIAGAPPVTKGSEQFIEVRMHIHTDYEAAPSAKFPPQGASSELIMGYQGCWVYIVGKKHLME